MNMNNRCSVCFRKCIVKEGKTGFCGARAGHDGRMVPLNYGRISSIALDPIEKKPFRHFMPGSVILSVGSYGCNLRCPFCQNSSISWSDEAMNRVAVSRYMSPDELVSLAVDLVPRGNIGVAFTYNEPVIGYEFVRDTSRLLHQHGLRSVMVTNGTASLSVLAELDGLVDAMNIDLKGFTDSYYRKVLRGDLEMCKNFISEAVRICHVELTTLIVTGENDSEEEIRKLSQWVAGLTDETGMIIGTSVPLHLTRFFPSFRMNDRKASDVSNIYHLADVAREYLEFVYTGNC